MKENGIVTFKQAEITANKYRDHLIGKDFLTGDQMKIGYENNLDQPFIVEVVPAPPNDKIAIECVKSFLHSDGQVWDDILKATKWDKDEYIVIVIGTNNNRNEYANELGQFLSDHPQLVLK